MANRERQKTIIIAFIVLCMVILAGRLVFVQLINKEYKITASNNVLRYEIVYPARGLIYDRNGNILVESQFAYDIMITPVSYTHLRAHETVLDLVCRLLLEKKKQSKKMRQLFPTLYNNTFLTQCDRITPHNTDYHFLPPPYTRT